MKRIHNQYPYYQAQPLQHQIKNLKKLNVKMLEKKLGHFKSTKLVVLAELDLFN